MARRLNLGDKNRPNVVERETIDNMAIQYGTVEQLNNVLERQKIVTKIETEKKKQAEIDAERKNAERTPLIKGSLISIGAILTFLGIGDSLRPDTDEYMRNANEIELAIFHNETDPEKLLVIGLPLIAGGAYQRRKKGAVDSKEESGEP